MTGDDRPPDLARLTADALARHPLPDGPVVLGVSGGGDSIALMQGLARACPGRALHVVTVDHGLRVEARDEAALVARQAAALGIPHRVVAWRWDGRGNLQAAAREGRRAALAGVAGDVGAAAVALGHTADDQIETFLMRLARGSGVDGLSAMAPVSRRDGLALHRPLLGLRRETLRAALRALGCDWAEDASNADARFDRVRARAIWPELEALGLTADRLLRTVEHLRAARLSLDDLAEAEAARHVTLTPLGEVHLAAPVLDLSREVNRRLLAAALAYVGGGLHRPRYAALGAAAEAVARGERRALAGCLLWPRSEGGLRVLREPGAVEGPRAAGGAATVDWDGRWAVTGPFRPGMRVAALGPRHAALPDWRATGAALPSVQASPAVFDGDVLLAAPAAGLPEGFSARLSRQFAPRSFAIEDRG